MDTQMDTQETPVTPAAEGGSGLFRRPLKRKVTPSQQIHNKLSELLKRHERQDTSDREMLQSLVSSVNRLVVCMETDQRAASRMPAPLPYSHPGPSTYHQSVLYMQQQQQQQQSYPSNSLSPDEPHYTQLQFKKNVLKCLISQLFYILQYLFI